VKLISVLIQLEYHVNSYKTENGEASRSTNGEEGNVCTVESTYSPGHPIPQQRLFFKAVLSAITLKVC